MILGAASLLFGCTPYEKMNAAAFEQATLSADARIVDVRTAEEFAEGHLPGAVNFDWKSDGFLPMVKAAFESSKPLYLYCRTGVRSGEAAKALAKAGYEVVSLIGGIEGWKADGKPVTKYEVERYFTDSGLPVDVILIKHGTLAISAGDVWIQIDPVTSTGRPPTTLPNSRKQISS